MTNDKLEKITERIDRALYYSMKKITDSEVANNLKTGEELLKLESKILIHYCLCRVNSLSSIVGLKYLLNRMININKSDVDFEAKLNGIENIINYINMR